MGKCESQVFSRFTAECIARLRARIEADGLGEGVVQGGDQGASPGMNEATFQDLVSGQSSLEPASGKASKGGFDIAWQYDPASQTLTIQCIASPFYAPCSAINARIRSLVESCYPVQSAGG